MAEHPYDLYLASRTVAPGWHNAEFPNDASEANDLLRRAITMVAFAENYNEHGVWEHEEFEPYDVLGLRIDGWIQVQNGYEFAFRIDKDIPYVVSFFNNHVTDVWDWKIEHWEV